jgi:Ca2+-binding RTX toxin-like protein
MSPSFNASITGAGTTVAQASAVDNVTTGTVTTADLVDTYTAIAAAATTVINPATSVTANGTGAGQAIDMSVLGRGVTIFGLGGNDTITGTSFADSIEGGAGLDSLTGGLGSDTFVLTDAFATSTQTITDFATGGAGDVLQVDISDFGLAGSTVFIGTEAAVDVNGGDEIIVLTTAHANDSAAAVAVAGTVNVGALSAVIVYFNNTTNVVHVIRVSDTDTGAGVVHVATLANLTTLVSLTGGAVASNFTPRP